MAYKAPIWEDGNSPAISAENLNALSQAAEGAQVLYGNSAPTPSTEGAVGQFYLVVVADSDGNYPLYQCVAIANGSYTWRDTRRIPDSITSMLGIPAPGTINSALNVLANIGNVHVWSRSWVVSEPVPEVPPGYTLGEVRENVVLASRKTSISTKGTFYYYFGDSVTVENDGTVNNPPDDAYTFLGRDISASTVKSGPLFVKGATDYIGAGNGYPVADLTSDATKVFYIPAGGALIVTVEPDPNNSAAKICRVVATRYQLVTGFPYVPAVPAGKHTEFLTSTQPAAYPEGTVDGVTTINLGQLGDKARIEVGSYVGTGKYGSSNKNSLTFPFVPKMLILSTVTNADYVTIAYRGQTEVNTKSSSNASFVWSGNVVSWYNGSNTDYQLNTSGVTYNYIAIG